MNPQYRSFIDVWHKCIPEIQIMSPRTDVCAVQYVKNTVTKLKQLSQRRTKFLLLLNLLIILVKHKQSVSTTQTNVWKVSLSFQKTLCQILHTIPLTLRNNFICHTIPVMYFKVGRKVQLFGICCDSNNIQVNYLIDESETIGKNGTKSHGANSVVSMLDHYFTTHSLQESVCYCHADNCVGQNKNRFVIGYFAWQVITGKHTQIHLSFMEVGHTRCLVAELCLTEGIRRKFH